MNSMSPSLPVEIRMPTLGKIGPHNMVIAVLPRNGNNAAASVAAQLLNDFP